MMTSVLSAPVRGLLWIARELMAAVDGERQDEEDGLMDSLVALHRRLDRGEIGETQFAVEEAELLDRIDALKRG